MIRRAMMAAAACVLCGTATVAFARTVVVAQRSTVHGAIYISHALQPGHAYSIEVAAGAPYQGNAVENYTFVYKSRLYTNTASISLHGSRTAWFQLKRPTVGKTTGWSVVIFVQGKARSNLTVKLVDTAHR